METRWTKNPSRWELEWGIRKIRGGLKNQPHRSGGILKNHLSCTVPRFSPKLSWFRRRRFFSVLTIYGHGSHLDLQTMTVWRSFQSPFNRRLHMVWRILALGFQRRSCYKVWKDRQQMDGRTTMDDGWQVITTAHPEPCSGELKNRYSRWRSWQPSWICLSGQFSYFWSTSHPDSYQVSTGLSVQEMKQKIDFQDGSHGRHFGFPITTISAIFFKSIGHLVEEKKRKIDFQDGCQGPV